MKKKLRLKFDLYLQLKNGYMKNLLKPVILISGLLFVQFAQAQTLDEIIDKHLEDMGGRQKIMTLTSALMTGTFATPGASVINIITTKKNMIGSRIDIDANGVNNYQVITPENGWIYTPIQGDKAPRPLAEDQVKMGQVQLDLHGPFINYGEKRIKIEMAGKDTVNSSICYKLKVKSPNGNVTDYYIDNKSGFVIKTSTKIFQYGALEDFVTMYSDYRKNADGFWFAYNISNQRGDTKYESITTNIPVDEKIFKVK